ncbi:hypothetical protein GCM10007877_09120 [Marinibactrum halimedae]|uniref:Tetratricopeptide repeat protein n=1 Tax=Marinibactrum halimedae TaxID=1444977 RepID=A0AA37T4T3_9GAMM|nr:hypothetical protein GCM10007877_09120 [Marinibactrum halimedae]
MKSEAKPTMTPAMKPVDNRESSITAQPQQPSKKDRMIAQLLADAERAMTLSQYMTPVEDNAHDRYRAVMLIDPDNKEAAQGIRSIAQRYLSLAKALAERGQFGSARNFVSKARNIHPHIDGIASVEAAIQTLEKQNRQQPVELVSSGVDDNGEGKEVVALPVRALDQRSDVLKAQLQKLAVRVKNSDEFMLIVARNDTEGRWIYQEMKKAVPGYRLRGDIRRGKSPKIILEK